jgi:sortase (surface protein transpeptidase)
MYQVAWWSDGPRAGERKNGLIPVLLGHTLVGGYGVFNRLGELQSGQTLILAAADPHKVLSYKVIKVITGIPKDDASALQKAYGSRPKAADLAAITCSGGVDERLKSQKENTMVFFAQTGSEGK